MNELALRLLPDNQEPQELVLQQHRLSSTILDMANATSSYVFNDYKYRAKIVNCDDVINNLIFLLNGREIDITYYPDTGMIDFRDCSFGRRIFLECYGFVQITLIFEDVQGNRQIKETEFIQVLVRKGQQNDSVRRMAEYVYAHNADLLDGNRTIPKDLSGLKESDRKTIEAHILLLKQISVVYEENYRYFKMNSRFLTIPRERVDHFEKLQYVSHNTLQYIARHPEELQQVHQSSGIRIGNFRYQPNKTLVTNNEKSYGIYENRVVLGFLLFLLREIERIQKELSGVISRVPQKIGEAEGYVSSSYFIYEKTIEGIRIFLNDVCDLHYRFTSLYYLYSEILPIKPEKISIIPRFTPLFKAIPQYHQIYNCAVAWFSKGAFTIREEQFMLSFIKISALYEVYVLTKLINYFKNSGYTLIGVDKVSYPSPGRYFENTDCNNRFVFKNDSGQVTVYYQPVIYNTNRYGISGIGLYRNTSISYPKMRDGVNYHGRYYTPDFLVKYEYVGTPIKRYIIADAKFSRLQTVKDREVAELAYKYLFSISPVSPEEYIAGLCIFNGISESENQEDSLTNIYDFELENTITPRANVITLTETLIDNVAIHTALLKNSVGLYVTETIQKPVPLPISHRTEDATPLDNDVQSRSERLAVHNGKEHAEKIGTALNSALTAESSNKQRDPIRNKLLQHDRTLRKKAKGSEDIGKIKLSELKLDKDIETRLMVAGYVTVQDLIPNKEKNDLLMNPILNRKCRREIEARLKQRKILLQ